MSKQEGDRGYDSSEPSTSSGYRRKPYDRDSDSVSNPWYQEKHFASFKTFKFKTTDKRRLK